MKYKPELDGLRSIAVLSVLLYHFGVPGVKGGYVGVDIFFVLSGFLISSKIFESVRQGEFSYLGFYSARIKRLFPAYLAMLFVCSIASYLILLPTDYKNYGQSVLASSLYASNILFFMEAGYFDVASHLKPLLHTWSLSIEEQFYILFPPLAILFYGAFGSKDRILWCLIGLASLVAAILYMSKDQSAVFYLLPFRAWELLLGVAIAAYREKAIFGGGTRNFLAFTGMAGVLLPAFLYDKSTPFPGVAAMLPTFGTAAIIVSVLSGDSVIKRLLVKSPMVYIGKLSYSLYLWHWPVVVFITYFNPEGLNVVDQLLMVVITALLSVLSYYCIETPVRRSKAPVLVNPFSAIGVFIGVCGILALQGLWVHLKDGVPGRLSDQTLQFANTTGDLFGRGVLCQPEKYSQLGDIRYCTIGDFNFESPYVLVWGDSHAGAFFEGLEASLNDKNIPALVIWEGGCPPVLGIKKDETAASAIEDEKCHSRNQLVRELISNNGNIQSIVMIGRWSYYYNGSGIGVDSENLIEIWPDTAEESLSLESQTDLLVESMRSTFSWLESFPGKKYIVEQPPEFPNYTANLLALSLMYGKFERPQDMDRMTTINYQDVLERQGSVVNLFNDYALKEDFEVLRTHHYFCDNGNCSIMIDQSPAYFDNNHVSATGARMIRDMFTPIARHDS